MNNYLLQFYFLQIFIIHNTYSIIFLPFRISGYKNKEKGKYNVTDYINEYLNVDIFTTVEIGSPPQKVTTLISQEDKIFSLSSDVCEKNTLEYIADNSIVSKTGLDLNKLETYNNKFNNSIFINYKDEEKNIGIIIDSISLYNTKYLTIQPIEWGNKNGNKDNKIKIDNFTMIIKDYKNGKKLCGRIGIASPSRLNGGTIELKNITSFFDYLKNNNIINDISWTIKLYNLEEGRFIIGGLPHQYESNSTFYNEKKYRSINSYSPHDPIFPWSIRFDSINFVNSKNETIHIQKGLRTYLSPNIGFIVGEELYKKLILENYFQELINKKICILDKITKTKFTKAYNFGTNGIYEIFHCNKSLINVKDSFPNLNFEFKEQNLNFYLTFFDLFQLIDERYFFLVIFPDNIDGLLHSFWYLGLPFYKAYQFVFNFDSKTIGVYEQSPEANKDIEEKNEGNKKKFKISRTLLEIIFGILLILIAFFIGKKINEQRKKRANELNDDYEYY